MPDDGRMYSTSEAAALCRVPRSTVGYWLRSGKLDSERSGKKYFIKASALAWFLKTNGREVPKALADQTPLGPAFRSTLRCWDYWNLFHEGNNCVQCVVYSKQLEECFSAKWTKHLQCQRTCTDCKYYMEVYFPAIEFISQINAPSIVYKGLHVWAGNEPMAHLLGVEANVFPGYGMERLVHADSLGKIIAGMKDISLGAPEAVKEQRIFLNSASNDKIPVRMMDYPLNTPRGARLVIFDQSTESSVCP